MFRGNAAHRCPHVPSLWKSDPGQRQAGSEQVGGTDEGDHREAGHNRRADRGENQANRIEFPPKTAHSDTLGGNCYILERFGIRACPRCWRRALLKMNGGRDRTRTCDLLRVNNRGSFHAFYLPLGFQKLGASAFAQPTSSEGSTETVMIRRLFAPTAGKPLITREP